MIHGHGHHIVARPLPLPIPGRSAHVNPSAAAAFHLRSAVAQHLLDAVRRASGNNMLAVSLVQRALPSLQRVIADFPHVHLGIGRATAAANYGLHVLDRLCQHASQRIQAEARMDIAAIRQLDQDLRIYGLHVVVGFESASGEAAKLTARQ